MSAYTVRLHMRRAEKRRHRHAIIRAALVVGAAILAVILGG